MFSLRSSKLVLVYVITENSSVWEKGSGILSTNANATQTDRRPQQKSTIQLKNRLHKQNSNVFCSWFIKKLLLNTISITVVEVKYCSLNCSEDSTACCGHDWKLKDKNELSTNKTFFFFCQTFQLTFLSAIL